MLRTPGTPPPARKSSRTPPSPAFPCAMLLRTAYSARRAPIQRAANNHEISAFSRIDDVRADKMSLTFRHALTVLTDCAIIPALLPTKWIQPPFASTTAGLAVGVTAAVVLACAGGAYLYSRHHMTSLLENARS